VDFARGLYFEVIHTVVDKGPATRILVNKFHGFDNLAGPADGGDLRDVKRT
jgi:hypothetical protein